MKYIQQNEDTTFTLKLNEGIQSYSGTTGYTEGYFFFEFVHVQTKSTTGFTLQDISDKNIVFSKFVLESGMTSTMNSGQYFVSVYENSDKTVLVTSDYFTFVLPVVETDIVFEEPDETKIIFR